MRLLSNKNLLIVGANSEITKAIADKSVQENAKFVSCIFSNQSNLMFSKKINLLNYDLLDFNNQQLLEFIEKKTWDCIVYAGGKGGVRPIKLNNSKFVSDMFSSNVFTFFELIRILVKKKKISEGASIVALSSVSSFMALKSKSVYSASKAALDAAVRCFASELAPKKIRVNSIQKGWVSSDINLDFIKNSIAIGKDNDMEKQILGLIEPIEIAEYVTFLLSDKVKSVTGTNLLIDGGYTL